MSILKKKVSGVFLSLLLLLTMCSCDYDVDTSKSYESTVADIVLETAGIYETEALITIEDTQQISDYRETTIAQYSQADQNNYSSTSQTQNESNIQNNDAYVQINISNIPNYAGASYTVLNNNIPNFADSEMSTKSYEYYSALDSLGRCGVVYACIGKDIMPTEERGTIGAVKPSGWHTVKYDCVDGKYLYNRCHLIGYQLTGENANVNNLITGTRYMNTVGMLPFENKVADYITSTGNHVLYRVTPIYSGNNLLANGVHMEAKSVEDNGAGILFNIYVYNVQPGIVINYATGDSYLNESATEVESTKEKASASVVCTYVLNTNTKKFHYPTCSSVETIKANNRSDYSGDRESLVQKGYSACKRCNP